MLESISEIKILYNNNFNKRDYQEEESLSFDNFKSIAEFIGNNFKINGALQTISFIGDNLFEDFENNLLQIIQFIKNLNKNYQIKLYFNKFEGDKKIFETLAEFSNIRFIYNLGYQETLIPESNMNMLLDYFPLTMFNYYITPENYKDTSIEKIWTYYSNFNLFYFNFEFEFEKIYSEEFYEQLDTYLHTIDLDVIEQIRNYSITTIPAFYKYMLWKIGALNYCLTSQYKHITLPEQMCAYKCGYGCYKNLIIDKNGEIYSCYKLFNANEADIENFHIGNIHNGLNSEKIENLIINSIDHLNAQNDKVLFNNEDRHYCNDCKLKNICTRGCPTTNYLMHHNYFSHSQTFCEINLMLYEHAFKLITFFEASKTNSLFKDLFTGAVKLGEGNYEC